MIQDKRRAKAAKRKEILSTLSDDSGCISEPPVMGDCCDKTDVPDKDFRKIDIPYVPPYLHSDEVGIATIPRHLDKQNVKTKRVHFEFLARMPVDPLKRPNWWISDEESTSDSESAKSEPDDVTVHITRPAYRRPYSTPDYLYTSDKITKTGDVNELQSPQATSTPIRAGNDNDKIPKTRLVEFV